MLKVFLDILHVMAPPLGRSDTLGGGIEIDVRNADPTKRPRNRSGEDT